MTSLGWLDYAVLAAYLVATLVLGLAIGSRIHTGKDYFLGGRRLPWWAIGMSLVATDIGGTDMIGVGGQAYRFGLAVANFEWIGCVPAMIVAAFLFIPFFWRLGIYTIPEYMEHRFNAGVRSALAFCWLVFMASNLGIMLLASAKMMSLLFGWDPVWCIYATAAMVGLYTFAGGLAAVVYTDTIQCVVMIGGCLLVLVLGVVDVGGVGALVDSLRHIQQQRAQPMGLILPADTVTPYPWPGIFVGLAMILSPAYWIGNQAIVQRSLGARSAFEAKAAYVWGALLKNLIPLIIVTPGLIALVKFPHLEDGDHAFPALVSALLPTGLKGVFLAAFIAALMSSIDSYLNSASVILTNDLYQRFFRPAATERQLLWFGRGTTLLLVVWAVSFALYLLDHEGGIYTIFQTIISFFQGPAFAILMSGLLWRRATGKAALVGFVAGVLFAVLLFALSLPDVCTSLGIQPLFQVKEPFLYFSVWAFLLTLVLVVVVSLCTEREPDEKLQYVLAGGRMRSRA